MSTNIKPEVSKNNAYWIPKHRYYELSHFCRQFWEWQKLRNEIDSVVRAQSRIGTRPTDMSNPVEEAVERREEYTRRIKMVMDAAARTDITLKDHILIGVTRGLTYDKIRARYNVPCNCNEYYELYRRFFWILDKMRN